MTTDLKQLVNVSPEWHSYLEELERCDGIAPFVAGNEVPRGMLNCGSWEKVTEARVTTGSLFLHVNVADAYHEPMPEFPRTVRVNFWLVQRTDLAAIATLLCLIAIFWMLSN